LIYFFININNTWKIQINISNNRVHRKQVQIKHRSLDPDTTALTESIKHEQYSQVTGNHAISTITALPMEGTNKNWFCSLY